MRYRPSSAARCLRLAAAALALITLGALLLSLSGMMAPRPAGPSQATACPGRLITTDERYGPAFSDLPPRSTLVLDAAYLDGEIDSGYGIRISDGALSLVAAVSPAGYVAVWETTPGGARFHVPWQTWPHVRPGAAANELWLDLAPRDDTTQVRVRVNRELLWSGTMSQRPQTGGVWLGSFGGGAAAVDFRTLTLNAPTP